MRYSLAADAKPQVKLLLTATAITFGIWIVSWFVPAASWVVYPLQLFATFIHESSHALVAILTGNTVSSLSVAPDGSGIVWSQSSGLSSLLISSAGYLGTTAFGIALLAWIRYGFSSRLALYLSAGLVGVMTVVFGLAAPVWNLLERVTFLSVVFTVTVGTVLTVGLAAVARFARPKWVDLSLAFLAVQCLLNAVFGLRDLFLITATSEQSTDAANMAAATYVPAMVWVFIWVAISLVMLTVGLRLYAAGRKGSGSNSVFES